MDIGAVTSSFAFDHFTEQVYPMLISGGTLLVLTAGQVRDFQMFHELMETHCVTVLSTTPGVLNQLNRSTLWPGLRQLITGADVLKADDISNIAGKVSLFNYYGPTEATVSATYYSCSRDFPEQGIPIGKPFANYRVYILDRYLKPAAIGVPGEICIAGDAVAGGYLNRPELTAEKFAALEDLRIYRTGDLGRRLNDGNIQFMGRIDHQVKIRGYRIELGEIENRLLQLEPIAECAVMVVPRGNDNVLCAYVALDRQDPQKPSLENLRLEGNDNVLCAYVALDRQDPQKPSLENLRLELAKVLPEYMIPAFFVPLPRLPKTATGKLDRKALPQPEITGDGNYVAPRNTIEKHLTRIWSGVLELDETSIGIDDNFFQLGGHSLKATVMASLVHKELGHKLQLADVFKCPTIRELAFQMDSLASNGISYEDIRPLEEKEYYSLSPAQQRMYFLQQMDPESRAYNMPLVLPLDNDMQTDKIELALKKLLQRHESLRTSFHMIQGEPVQRVHKDVEFKLRQIGPMAPGEPISDLVKPFDLTRAPLLRSALVTREDGARLWLVDMHHIISDGASHAVLISDFRALYEGEELKPLSVHYKDYAGWRNALRVGKRLEEQMKYWLEVCRGELPRLQLPGDYPRPAVFNHEGKQSRFVLEAAETIPFKRLTRASGGTLYMNILAALNCLFYKYTGQTDILIGGGAAGRPHADLRRMIGMFIDILVMRNFPDGALPYRAFLDKVVENSIKAFDNQDVQFEELVNALEPERDTSRNPLFDVSLVVQNFDLDNLNPKAPAIDYDQYGSSTSKFDMTFSVFQQGDEIHITVEYYSAVYSEETIKRMEGHFKNLIKAVSAAPDMTLDQIDILTREERRRVLYDFNNTVWEYPEHKTLHGLFEEQVEKTPDHIALLGENGTNSAYLTYKELNHKACELADNLRRQGLRDGAILAIGLRDPSDAVVDILATLKAGAAYLPIDPSYPQERIGYMLKDSSAVTLLLDPSSSLERASRRLEPMAAGRSAANSLAYVIYTSGTTGRPKGVAVEHGQIVNTLSYRKKQYLMTDRDISLQLFSFAFDGFLTSFFTPLISGSKIVLPGKQSMEEVSSLRRIIVEHCVSHFIAVPPLFHAIIEGMNPEQCRWLKLITLAGDQLPPALLKLARRKNKNMEIAHEYGVTEAAVMSTLNRDQQNKKEVSLGNPIANTAIYILDQSMNPRPIGLAGELCIAGNGIARGYLNQPELTAQRFTDSSFHPTESSSLRLYKTGDLARWLTDGSIQFLGRIDHQVKIRGFRIELGEIENTLTAHQGVREAVLVTRGEGDARRLCAYVTGSGTALPELKKYLSQKLPAYMIPSSIIHLDRIPLTANGKIDRKALPLPELEKDKSNEIAQVEPASDIEKLIADTWKEVLGVSRVSIHDNLFEIGGNSLNTVRIAAGLKEKLKRDVPVVQMFRFPTIHSLANYLQSEGEEETQHSPVRRPPVTSGGDVAVIGMAGRFPGANNIAEFLENLKNGVDGISFFSHKELEEAGVDPGLLSSPAYVKGFGVMANAECFDAAFFDYTPVEAEIMNPQIRVFHEVVWETLEDAGYNPETYEGSIGLYAGASSSFQWEMFAHFSGKAAEMGSFAASNLTDARFLSTRVAYKLNLRGPANIVQTACSTSLVAIHQAYRGILSGECDMTLAGGVAIQDLRKQGYLYQEGMIQSPDGHCRAFDERSGGTVGGSGAAAVLLKPLDAALADRDYIYAIIKGSASNNDGKQKAGYTAPGIEGQASVISDALVWAGVNASTIGYVETHGTGTALGDPVEIEGLKLAFNRNAQAKDDSGTGCALGSVKANLGHLDAAAGVAGFIKAVLSLHHGLLFPTPHFERPNWKLDLNGGQFYINQGLNRWEKNGTPLRAGVSSFGIGGTNAHLILEQAPPRPQAGSSPSSRPYRLLTLSAKTRKTLEIMAANLAAHLESHPDQSLEDIAYTLHLGRKPLPYRAVLACVDKGEALETLNEQGTPGLKVFRSNGENPPLVFMFPGYGAQYENMGVELYRTEPVFREEIDRCLQVLTPLLGRDIKPLLYPEKVREKREKTPYKKPDRSDKINLIENAQPLLFIFEYALARLSMHWGVRPTMMIGYSLGEYAAAAIAGVFSLKDALRLVTLRGKLMRRTEPGAMLSAPLNKAELLPLLPENIELAIESGPELCMAAGTPQAVAEFEKVLNRKGIETSRLNADRAYHSRLMEPVLDEFLAEIKTFKLAKPRIPFISNLTGLPIRDDEAIDPVYWMRHFRETVQFNTGLDQCLKYHGAILIEMGPGKGLSNIVRQHPARTVEHSVINTIPHPKETGPDARYLLERLGWIWANGGDVDWLAYYKEEKRYRVPLPAYPFQRRRFTVDTDSAALQGGLTPARPLARKDMDRWFYMPVWEQSAAPVKQVVEESEDKYKTRWLIFMDDTGLGLRIGEKLEAEGHGVLAVTAGNGFASTQKGQFTIDPAVEEDYELLFTALKESGHLPGFILHLWNLPNGSGNGESAESEPGPRLEKQLDQGFYSILNSVRAMVKRGLSGQVKYIVVTANVQDITGEEELRPLGAAALGAVKVIPLEYSNIQCRNIDILPPSPGSRKQERLASRLIAECLSSSEEVLTAYRGNHRWVRSMKSRQMQETPSGSRLKKGGVYLIAGGFGGLGFTFAHHLARQWQARLVLVTRTTLADDPRVEQLKTAAADVLVFNADISDIDKMQELARRVKETWGRVDGIIHAAGVVDGEGVIQNRSRSQTEKSMAAKVKGTLVLNLLFNQGSLDFFVICSSLGNMLYKVKFGQVGYSAANEFLDAFAAYSNQMEEGFTATINWGDWVDVGMAIRAADRFNAGESAGDVLDGLMKEGITPAEGVVVLEQVLSGDLPRLAVSPHDLDAMLDYMNRPAPAEAPEEEETEILAERPELASAYAAPRTATEKKLAHMWRQFFGIESIGIHDDFFELGGDSLKAMSMSARLSKQFQIEVPLAEFFARPTIKEMALFVESAGKKEVKTIEPVEKREYYSLSSAQKRIYFLQEIDRDGIAYNVLRVMGLGEQVKIEKIETALRQLIARHESLRTAFLKTGENVENVYQCVHDEVEFQLETLSLTADETMGEAVREFIRPFDLTKAPLLRARLISHENRESDSGSSLYTLLVDMHHIICDGTSMAVLTEDFGQLYGGMDLEPLNLHYKDFSQWQNHLIATGGIKKQEKYWLDRFAGELPLLDLPADFPRPEVFTFAGDIYRFHLEDQLTAGFKALLSAAGTTLYMTILAALNTLFYKLTGRTDIIIGGSIAGRSHADTQRIIGMFVNSLAMRNHPSGGKSFNSFLEEVKQNTLEAFENQDVQFEDLVDKLDLERDPSRTPLFDVNMAVQNIGQADMSRSGLAELAGRQSQGNADVSAIDDDPVAVTSKFDLTFFIQDSGDRIECDLEYYSGIFKRETVGRLVSHFKNVIAALVKAPDTKLKDIDFMTAREKQKVLHDFNATDAEFPRDQTLHALFQRQAERTPDALALVDHLDTGGGLSYKELNARADQFAAYLRFHRQVGHEDRVGLALIESVPMVISILGILKAGACYVPVNPGLPEERLKYIIDDAGISLLVSEKKYIKQLNRLQWECAGLHTFICMDSQDIEKEEALEQNDLMDEELWSHVAEESEDEITGGGWVSSYTGELFSRKEMDEYGENILTKLEPLLSQQMRVLEIGCASGITMFRLAPRVSLYYGTDLSREIIEKDRIRAEKEGHENIKLACLKAHEIDEIEEGNFDLIIINSVIHCFHGHNYLRKVFHRCVDKLNHQGHIFIGDIMDRDLKAELEKDMLNFKKANTGRGYTTKTDFQSELFISRAFWQDVAAGTECIEDIRFSGKIHTLENELTRYRYDALFTVNKTGKTGNVRAGKAAARWKKIKHRDDLSVLSQFRDQTPVLPQYASASGNLAYIIYTSGTTGKPKGVMVEHRGAVDYICWAIDSYVKESPANFPLFTSITFDLTVTSVFTPLLSGNTLVVYGDEEKGLILNRIIEDNKVQVIKCTPSHLKIVREQVIDANHTSLRRFIVGGEELESALAGDISRLFADRVEICNEYGPTETVVGSMIHLYDPGLDKGRAVSIGKPSANTRIFILDGDGNPVPIGIPGEICISGEGMARGYLNNPELSAQKFTPIKSVAGGPGGMYRTGDRGRWDVDGNIQFLGRIDDQVKIRGYRIECGEIQSRTAAHDSIKDALVVARTREEGEYYLCAYIVTVSGPEAAQDVSTGLREFLSQSLPDYMIPSYFVEMDRIPLTANGKVDRKALPEPGVSHGESRVMPRNRVEEKLAAIWSEVLAVEQHYIGVEANFFQLGGHSLKATVMTTRIHKELNVKVPLAEVFKRQTLETLAAYIAASEKSKYTAISPAEKKEYYPLSSAQKRLYFVQQMDLDGTAYNMPLTLTLGDDTDKERLESTLKKLIRRHECLRTSFLQVDGVPYQRVHDDVAFEIEEIGPIGQTGPMGPMNNILKPFDLSEAPLLRSVLSELPGGGYLWLVDIHHIVSDGTSQGVLMEDFAALYREHELEPLRLHYKDFSQWQNHLFESGGIRSQEQYWLDLHQGEIPVLELPADFKRPAIFSFKGDYYSFQLDEERTRGFSRLAVSSGGTLYMNMLTALTTLLYKYSGRDDIIIGSGIAGRPHADLQRIIGMFVNTLAMRTHPAAGKTYRRLLDEIIQHSIDAFENQDVQFEELVEHLDIQRDPSRNPLFDVNMVVQNFKRGEIGENLFDGGMAAPAEQLSVQESGGVTSKFDLQFFVMEREGRVSIDIEYYTGIFRAETIARMAGHFKNIIDAVNRDGMLKLAEIDVLSDGEREQLLYDFNRTEAEFPADKTLHQLFAEQALRTPDRLAAAGPGEEELSYAQLNGKAAELAAYLVQRKGVRLENRVGLAMDRSLAMIVSILGILKAGAAYVPMNPMLPVERLKYIIDDAGIEVMVSSAKYIKTLNLLQWDCPGLRGFICMDTENIDAEEEREESALMDEKLWMHVGETAGDEITGGGWVSSYTGEVFSSIEMDEYGENIVKKLVPLLHEELRVLEIGCASGITMFRLAPKVGLYHGTDLSSVIIEKGRRQAEREGYNNIKLACLKAHEISAIDEGEFDLIIINSVIHCFHGHNYLRDVIRQCVDLLAEKGHLFIGDIMDNDLKSVLEKDMRAFKIANEGKGYTTKTDFSAELFISRDFWRDLAAELGVIDGLEFSRKIHTVENELTRYRYDAMITIDKSSGKEKRQWSRQRFRDDLSALTGVSGESGTVDSCGAGPAGLAYIIYTSGTTGKPKGVMVEHRGAVDYIWWAIKNYVGDERVDFPLFTSITFDLTVTSVFTPLLSGNAVRVYEDDGPGFVLDRIIADNRVGVIKCTPSHLKMIRDNAAVPGTTALKRFILGGEELETALAKEITGKFGGKIEIFNEYGPTETVVGSMIYRYDPETDVQRTVPIGKPADNTSLHILDKDGNLVPIGVSGEICISGTGMARGYLNNPELSAQKFTPIKSFAVGSDKLAAGGMYRTGDLGRWEMDGNIEFLGRIDDQVKVRGFRVEPGEIEARLTARRDIAEAVVEPFVREGGEVYLCAYIVSQIDDSPVQDIKDDLARVLPDYMVPAYIMPIERIPLTMNGKLDRKALPQPEVIVSDCFEAPRDPLEKSLAEIWSSVLGISKEKIGIRDNFFDLGGNSLNLVRLVSLIAREFMAEIPLARLYQSPLIEDIAAFIRRNAGKIVSSHVMRLTPPAREKLFCFPPVIGYGLVYGNLAPLLTGVETHAFHFIEEEDRLERYVETILSIQPDGPYRLFGWSAAGGLVFDVAAALENRGCEVSKIILADSYWIAPEDGEETARLEQHYLNSLKEGLARIGAELVQNQVQRKVTAYLAYKTGLREWKCAGAEIHVILSEQSRRERENLEQLLTDWQKSLPVPLFIHHGYGEHADMFNPGPLQKNADIIKSVLQ